jgi:hypothetical protein
VAEENVQYRKIFTLSGRNAAISTRGACLNTHANLVLHLRGCGLQRNTVPLRLRDAHDRGLICGLRSSPTCAVSSFGLPSFMPRPC